MDIVERCYDYLSNGGLFNPELMDHEAVSNLVIDCRNEIERLRQLNAELVAVIEESIDPESIEPVGTQVWLDKVYDLLDRATGGE